MYSEVSRTQKQLTTYLATCSMQLPEYWPHSLKPSVAL